MDRPTAERDPAWRGWIAPWLAWACRVTLGVVFIVAAVPKIVAPAEFAQSIANYHLLPLAAINALAIALPWVELLCGVLVLAGVGTRASLLVIVGLLAVFSGAIAAAMHRGLDIGCGCFSAGAQARAMTQWTLLWDIIWILMGGFALVYDRGKLSVAASVARARSRAGR